MAAHCQTTLESMKLSSQHSALDESAAQGEIIIIVMQNFLLLTILSDKSNAAVDYNRNTVFSQLLVTERIAVCASSQFDSRVPHGEIHLVEAMNVNCSIYIYVKKERQKHSNYW